MWDRSCPVAVEVPPSIMAVRKRPSKAYWGLLHLQRAYYHCERCESGFCPRDRAPGAGIVFADARRLAHDGQRGSAGKALKQTLKIKTFVGTSANAVRTQVWTALIAMLVLKYLQLKSSFSWSLSTLAALLRQQLFFYRDSNHTHRFSPRRLWSECMTMRNNWKSRGR
jgi:hypothetical protein